MYKHTQIGWVTAISLGLGILLLLVGYYGDVCSDWNSLLVIGIFVIFLVLFASLTVTGDGNSLKIKFGLGLIRKSFPWEEIESCTVAKNYWWYGWGIRKIPKGWLYNISGLDTVELSVKDGKVYRIGTDEPRELNEFIQWKLSERKQR